MVVVEELKPHSLGCGTNFADALSGSYLACIKNAPILLVNPKAPAALLDYVSAHLKAGGVAICNTAGRGMFSTGGHYVVALGFLGDKLCVADPGLYAGKYTTARRKAAVQVTGDLLLTDPSTLDADCVGRWPRYYLLKAVK